MSRLLAQTIERRLAQFPVVVVTGARQTGKTTLVQMLRGAASRRLVTLDSLTSLDQARREPEVLAASEGPITIDEAQRAPDLVVESGRRLLPVEVKAGRVARVDDARALDAFCEEFPSRAPFGLLLYDGAEALALTRKTVAVRRSARSCEPP